MLNISAVAVIFNIYPHDHVLFTTYDFCTSCPSYWPRQRRTSSEVTSQLLRRNPPSKHALKTGPNQAIFWSGKTNGVSAEVAAKAYAKANGGKTMNMVMQHGNINFPTKEPGPQRDKEWRAASKTFAKQAQGNVHAFLGKDVKPNRVYNAQEKPALIKNPKVTSITEHYHDGHSVVVHQRPPKGKREEEFEEVSLQSSLPKAPL